MQETREQLEKRMRDTFFKDHNKFMKESKRKMIGGMALGGVAYIFFVLFGVALNLGILAAGVYIVVCILRATGVL